jgi:hypothetical protein
MEREIERDLRTFSIRVNNVIVFATSATTIACTTTITTTKLITLKAHAAVSNYPKWRSMLAIKYADNAERTFNSFHPIHPYPACII